MGVVKSLQAYDKLLDKEYHIRLGNGKKTETNIRIIFDKLDWYHTMGLGYLKGVALLNVPSNKLKQKLYDDIIDGKYTDAEFETAFNYNGDAEDRINLFGNLENILDNIDNDSIKFYSFNKKRCIGFHTNINANYLVHKDTDYINLFLVVSHIEKDGTIVVNQMSFFSSRKNKDGKRNNYSKGQQNFTVLLNEKVDTKTGKIDELYRHPHYQPKK